MDRVLVEGTSGSDDIDLTGTTEPHRIETYDGNDTVRAGDGGDIIDGGSGHDAIWGGAGNDTIIAGSGINQYHGGGGLDLLQGSVGDDLIRILSMSGMESIDGGDGSDTIAGGNSNDYWDFSGISLNGIELIDLGHGWNRFTGTDGDDIITAGKKNDTINGGGGRDTFLYSGLFAEYAMTVSGGSVTVRGIEGKDSFDGVEVFVFADGTWENGVFTANDGTEQPTNTPPTAVDDTLTVTAGSTAVLDPLANDSDPDAGQTLAVTHMTQGANGTVTLSGGQWTYTPNDGFTGTDSFQYTMTDGQDTATATMTVTVEADTTTGGGGGGTEEPPPDTGDRLLVEGTSGADTIDRSGDTQDLEIRGYDGNDYLIGGSGNDILNPGGAHDALEGGAGNDLLLAGPGINQYHGGTGTDTLRGTDGDDLIRILSLSGLEVIDGGLGNDTLYGGGSNDYWDFSGVTTYGLELIDLGSGWNRFTGTSGDDRITAGGKNDTVDGGDGMDEFIYRNAFAQYTVTQSGTTITVEGADGRDKLSNVERVVFLDGVYENGQFVPDGGTPVNTPPVAVDDAYTTTAGVALTFNPLENDSDADPLDTLDVVMGSVANGTVEEVDGQWVYTPNDGFTGTETIGYTLTDGTDEVTATITITVEPTSGGGGGGGEEPPPPPGDYVVLEGTAGADRLDVSGDSRAHDIRGLGGNDTLYGGLAGDILDGGGGHNMVYGGAGNDVILGGRGANTYDGGSGTDTLRGTDGDDFIRIYTIRDIEAIQGGGGSDTLFTGDSTDTLDLSGVDVSGIELIDLGNGWNRFTGSDADETITAGGHGDIVDGGGGTNTFVYDGAFGDYTVAQSGSTISVTGIDGDDSLTNIQRLTFSDGEWVNGVFTPTGGTPVNRAPVAQNDSYSLTAGRTLTFDPLLNDSDPDNDTISVASNGQPQNGTLTEVDGQWTYTPDDGFTGSDSFDYTIRDEDGLTSTATVSISVEPATDPGDGSGPIISAALWDKLEDIALGGWGKLNLNSFSSVGPDPDDAATYGTHKSVIQAWSSMAWDSNRNDLIFWGGGHANYNGNEVYRFDTDTLTWERASLPSEVTGTAHFSVHETVDGPDNAPISSHTYDNQEFLPIADRFVTFGGAAYGSGSAFVYVDAEGNTRATGPYFWDPSLADPDKVGGTTGSGIDPDTLGARMWENRDAVVVNGSSPGSFLNGASDYTQIDGKDVVFISNNNMWKYTVNDVNDPSQDTWEQVGRKWEGFNGAGTGTYDPDNNIFVRSANGTLLFWDLDEAGAGNKNVNFTPTDLSGGFTMGPRMAMDYDPVRDRIVLWDGNEDVWELNAPDTEIIGKDGWTVKRLTPGSEGPDGVPDVDAYNQTTSTSGILGKWKYIPDLDIYLGVYDHHDGNIWAYKPEGWDPNVSVPMA